MKTKTVALGIRKRTPRSRSASSVETGSSKRQKASSTPLLDAKEGGANDTKSAYGWLKNPVENGYIQHPRAGWIIHPSFYDEDEPLCDAKGVCTHRRDCKEVRMRMAVFQYIRAEERKTPLSYREVELLWGVSHSTVQRRKVFMQVKSDVLFLITPYKKVSASAL